MVLLVISMAENLLERFFEKESQKTNQKEFRIEKVIKRKGENYMSKGMIRVWKGYNNSFNSWIDKSDLTSWYFPNFGENINVKVDLSNYATNADFKNIYLADTSRFTLKSNLASLKAKADKSDISIC